MSQDRSTTKASNLPMSPSAHDFSSTRLFWRWIGLSILLAVVDQASKLSIVLSLPLHSQVEVTSFFNLVHALNPGAAFSFLAGAGGWQRYFLTILGSLVSLGLMVLLKRGVRYRMETIGYVGIIGGAIGNVMDRVRIGKVVDFLDFHWETQHWPAFNLADVFIVVGVGLILVSSLRSHIRLSTSVPK